MISYNTEQLETDMKIFNSCIIQSNKEKFKTLELGDEVYIDISDLNEKKKIKIMSHNLGKFSGFIIEKNCSIEKFFELNYRYADYFDGLVITSKYNEYIVHSQVVQKINQVISNYCDETDFLFSSGSVNHVIPPKRIFSPDGSITRREQFTSVEKSIFVFEVNLFSQSISSAVRKCLRYFEKDSINMVLLIHIYERDINYYNRFKAVAMIFNRQISVTRPSTMVSFGTQRISQSDEEFYNNSIGLGSIQITGFIYNNNNFNNNSNNPPYILNISIQEPPALPIIIDLFEIKKIINRHYNFRTVV